MDLHAGTDEDNITFENLIQDLTVEMRAGRLNSDGSIEKFLMQYQCKIRTVRSSSTPVQSTIRYELSLLPPRSPSVFLTDGGRPAESDRVKYLNKREEELTKRIQHMARPLSFWYAMHAVQEVTKQKLLEVAKLAGDADERREYVNRAVPGAPPAKRPRITGPDNEDAMLTKRAACGPRCMHPYAGDWTHCGGTTTSRCPLPCYACVHRSVTPPCRAFSRTCSAGWLRPPMRPTGCAHW